MLEPPWRNDSTPGGTHVSRVVTRIKGEAYLLQPKFVLLCAGVGNIALLKNLEASTNPGSEVPVQAQRKNHMLIIRGKHLPPLTAVFPIRGGLQGVFLCSRRKADTNETVWLASDHNSTAFPFSTNGKDQLKADPSGEWVGRILVSLKATAPALFGNDMKQDLQFAVYTGLTSERNFGVGQHMTDAFIDPFTFDNLLAIWPTKLTLTPFASNVAIRFIRPKIPEPSGEWPTVDRPIKSPAPEVSPETWQREPFSSPTGAKTEWLAYQDFMKHWGASEPKA